MDTPRRPGPPPSDEGGGGGAWRPSVVYLAIALGVVAGGLAFLLMAAPSPTPDGRNTASQAPAAVAASPSIDSAPPPATTGASGPAPAAPVRVAAAARSAAPAAQGGATDAAQRASAPARDEGGDPTTDISVYLNPGETPTMAEVIDRLHQAGVYSGLGAFSPPGTRPPLVGLAVPEDYVLPEGYVRHYQATDDGQRIEPILMFSPDYQFYDAARRPIAIPEDRVVPPELAPPGLPMRRIVIPAPAEPGRPGR